MSIVTLLTDFGTADGYVGEMKGVVVSRAPSAVLVDITHDIEPGDIVAGAYALGRAWRRFPPRTVHLAVVDPGVGSSRRAIACEAGGQCFVGPDNGIFESAYSASKLRCVELEVPREASPVFHGRDVFAPAAAALAEGKALRDLGRAFTDPVRLPTQKPGTVVHVDRFGTLITNLTGPDSGQEISVAGRAIPVRRTFADVPSGELVAYVGSGGALEIAVRDGRADSLLKMKRGDQVQVSS